jgi:hypothetical protein
MISQICAVAGNRTSVGWLLRILLKADDMPTKSSTTYTPLKREERLHRVVNCQSTSRLTPSREAGLLRAPLCRRSSALQVELGAQSFGNRFDHVAPIRILRHVRHDHDFPGVLVWCDGNGQARRPFANVFHLQPDRGLEFFARFCWLLHASITGLRRGPGPPPIRAGP